MRNCSGLSKLNLSTSVDVENLLSVDPWRKWKRWWSKSFVTWNAIRSSSVTDVIRSLQVAPRAMARALLCLCLESGSQEDTNILEPRSFLVSACARSCVYFQMWTVSLPRTQATPIMISIHSAQRQYLEFAKAYCPLGTSSHRANSL
jgi:hypothetical protein